MDNEANQSAFPNALAYHSGLTKFELFALVYAHGLAQNGRPEFAPSDVARMAKAFAAFFFTNPEK